MRIAHTDRKMRTWRDCVDRAKEKLSMLLMQNYKLFWMKKNIHLWRMCFGRIGRINRCANKQTNQKCERKWDCETLKTRLAVFRLQRTNRMNEKNMFSWFCCVCMCVCVFVAEAYVNPKSCLLHQTTLLETGHYNQYLRLSYGVLIYVTSSHIWFLGEHELWDFIS